MADDEFLYLKVQDNGIGFDKAKIRFAKTLPPIENAQGQASLIDKRFTATAEEGVVIAEQGGAIDPGSVGDKLKRRRVGVRRRVAFRHDRMTPLAVRSYNA